MAAFAVLAAAAQTPPGDPLPQTLEEFQATAARVLEETAVPGAGIALVRSDAVEWAGGVGYADRDRRLQVTADTHFRVGSISKSFVALALVQLYEDGFVDLDSPVREVAPEIEIDNPWEDTEPVRLIHLLQHTAGFDDMHFNETYVAPGARELSLAEVLQRHPRSRRVRWPPGTRMSYSNPGYGVAGRAIELIADQPYEDYIEAEIFAPLEMSTSSFRLTPDEEPLLAQGYQDATGAPVGFPRIYHRPAGNMHSSAREMAHFVQMLLGWGERGTAFVVDPEYLSNMETPQTTIAARAGLRNGYGSGIFVRLDLPYRTLGHGGGIAGFVSTYGYSPARDTGYVVLLNSAGPRAGEALDRLSSLALRYLKREVAPAARPEAEVAPATLDRYRGYYQDASPRNQFAWPLQFLWSGVTVTPDREGLIERPLFGASRRLVPVTDSMFRLEDEIDASRVFTTDANGAMVMSGGWTYAERVPRWRVEIVRLPIIAALLVVASVIAVACVWLLRIRRAQPDGFWMLKIAAICCPLVWLLTVMLFALMPALERGTQNLRTSLVFVGTLAIPTLAVLVAIFTVAAVRQQASRWLVTYTALVSLAMAVLSLYLSSHGLLGLRTWAY